MALTITLTAVATFYLTIALIVYSLLASERPNMKWKESFGLMIFSLFWLPFFLLFTIENV